jgi:hypothetical protein
MKTKFCPDYAHNTKSWEGGFQLTPDDSFLKESVAVLATAEAKKIGVNFICVYITNYLHFFHYVFKFLTP